MNPRIQNNFYVEPFKNVRMKQMNYNGFCMEEFPQYKAFNNGLENLTSVELISLIIGTGTKKNVEQARQLFNVMKESLRNIAKARVEDLQVVQGIGDSKAIALQAAIELGKRYNAEKTAERPDLGSSIAIYNYLHPLVRDLESGNLRRYFGTGSRVNVNVYCKELGFTEKPLATTHVNVY